MPKPLKLGADGRPAVFQAGDTLPPANGGTGLASLPLASLCRLSASAADVADATGAGTIYLVPYRGNLVSLYDGTRFAPQALSSALSLTLSGLTSGKNYDAFVWLNGSTLTLSLGPAWTSDAARGTGAGTTEVTQVNGVWLNANAVTSGPAAQRGTLVGTIRATGAATTEDSTSHRFVSNLYNPVERRMALSGSTSHAYGTNAARSWNNSTANRVDFVQCVAGLLVKAAYRGTTAAGAGGTCYLGTALDGTAVTDGAVGNNTTSIDTRTGGYEYAPGVGYHFVQMAENSNGVSGTFYDFELRALPWN